MDRQQQQKLEDMAKQAQTSPGLAGSAGYDNATPMRETLTNRLRSRRVDSARQAERREQFDELIYLLDKNPEIARILDLIEAVGSY